MKFRKVINKIASGAVNCLAVLLVVQNVNSACIWLFGQPEVPEAANKYKKL